MQEYKLPRGSSLAIIIFATLLVALFVGCIIYLSLPAVSPEIETAARIPLAIVALVMAIMFTVAVVDTARTRVTIDSYEVTHRGAFGTRQIPLSAISGYRMQQKKHYSHGVYNEQTNLIIEPSDPLLKKISINGRIKDFTAIVSFFQARYPDLDAIAYAAEQQDILNDPRLGLTPDDRQASMKRARSVALLVNIFGAVAALCAFTLGQYSPYAIWPALATPAIAIASVVLNKGLISFIDTKTDRQNKALYGSVGLAVMAVAFGLLLFALMQFQVYDYLSTIPAFGILMVLLMSSTIIVANNNRPDRAKLPPTIFAYFIFYAMFSFGAVLTVNGIYDNSVATLYDVPVTGKYISRGKSTSYHLQVPSWGPGNKGNDLVVKAGTYSKVNIGDHMTVYLMQGYLGIKWYYLDQ